MDNKNLITSEDYNKRVKDWSADVKQQASSILASKTSSSGRLQNKLQNRVSIRDGLASAVGFRFYRYGVFVAYGVGRGYIRVGNQIVRGSRITRFPELVAQYRKRGYNNKDIVKMKVSHENSSINRKPVDWLDCVITDRIEILGDIAGEFYGDESLRHILSQLNNITIEKKHGR